ncbi:MAG: hypothetical protein KA152_17620 [Verrucomicrobiales bacterium]|nr:hypothetical protein [Verrucomicrobiales bacterium]
MSFLNLWEMYLLMLLRLTIALFLTLAHSAPAQSPQRPLFRDFVGLCGHTVQFKPELYQPVCRVVRDYHPVRWDLDKDTSVMPEWPFAKNRVSWEKVYRSWHDEGLSISVCLIFDDMKGEDWKDIERDARAYAKGFAENFGPGGKYPFVDCVEIGNEPGHIDDATYLRIFKAMAAGIREGNPRLKIATCNTEAGGSDRYWKGADIFTPQMPLIDVLRIHRYAIKDGWPTWRRSYPEDSTVPYLSRIQDMIDWRDAHAIGREMWVSEFGWDCSTQKPDPKGDMAKFITCTDEEQAMWLVRSYFLFAEMGIDKAFVYFFNDEDKPAFHACSGLTRNFQPKPGYHAIAWMLEHLADYRFSRAILKSEKDGYLFEFAPEKPGAPSILAAWHATREEVLLNLEGATVGRSERMPLTAEAKVESPLKSGDTAVAAGTLPILIWVN